MSGIYPAQNGMTNVFAESRYNEAYFSKAHWLNNNHNLRILNKYKISLITKNPSKKEGFMHC